MSKYDELKRLAEACEAAWDSYSRSDSEQLHDAWAAADGDFGAAANPAAILELIAEVEALRQDAARWKFVRSPVGTNSPFAVWHEGKMPVFSSIADRMVDDAMAREASK